MHFAKPTPHGLYKYSTFAFIFHELLLYCVSILLGLNKNGPFSKNALTNEEYPGPSPSHKISGSLISWFWL